MNKADKILIVIIMIISVFLLIPLTKNVPRSHVASVLVKNKEVMRIDLTKDADYDVKGTLGNVHIEVKDGSVAVTQENSVNHLCSKQGFVSSSNTPIVCLPNDTIVQIESDDTESQEDVLVQ